MNYIRKLTMISCACILLANVLAWGEGARITRGSGNMGSRDNISHPETASPSSRMGTSVMIRMRQQNVPRPQGDNRPARITRQPVEYPTHIGRSGHITQQATVSPPRQHATIVRDPAIMNRIHRIQRTEVVPRRYYWHRHHGIRYAHYYDRGIHWYGFYSGPTFYWTHYENGYWWWFDVNFNRWVYWQNDHWYWPGPNGATYVYVDNNYYPYDEDNDKVTVKTPEVVPPPDTLPAANDGTSSKSPDGTRMVQIFGENAEAFLYDTTAAQPVFLKYLGKDVESVRFSQTQPDQPTRVLINFKSGSFALYSANGDPIDEAPHEGSVPLLP